MVVDTPLVGIRIFKVVRTYLAVEIEAIRKPPLRGFHAWVGREGGHITGTDRLTIPGLASCGSGTSVESRDADPVAIIVPTVIADDSQRRLLVKPCAEKTTCPDLDRSTIAPRRTGIRVCVGGSVNHRDHIAAGLRQSGRCGAPQGDERHARADDTGPHSSSKTYIGHSHFQKHAY